MDEYSIYFSSMIARTIIYSIAFIILMVVFLVSERIKWHNKWFFINRVSDPCIFCSSSNFFLSQAIGIEGDRKVLKKPKKDGTDEGASMWTTLKYVDGPITPSGSITKYYRNKSELFYGILPKGRLDKNW